MSESLLDDRELSRRLNIARQTIQGWRHRKVGPPFVRVGRRIRYRLDDVNNWLNARTEHYESEALQ